MLEDKTDKKQNKLNRFIIFVFCSLSISILIFFCVLIGYGVWHSKLWGGDCTPGINESYDTRGFADALQEKLSDSQRDEYFVFFSSDADMQNAECYMHLFRKEEGCEVNPYFDSYGMYLSLGDNEINAKNADFYVDSYSGNGDYIGTYELDSLQCKLYYQKTHYQTIFYRDDIYDTDSVIYNLHFMINEHSYWLNLRCIIDKDNPHEFVGAEDAYAIDLAPSVLEYAENIIKNRQTVNEFIADINTNKFVIKK